MLTESPVIKHRVQSETGIPVSIRSLRRRSWENIYGYELRPATHDATPEVLDAIATAPEASSYKVMKLSASVCFLLK